MPTRTDRSSSRPRATTSRTRTRARLPVELRRAERPLRRRERPDRRAPGSRTTGRRRSTSAAPGTNIYSTWPGGVYRFADGTSMAAPHVVGRRRAREGGVPVRERRRPQGAAPAHRRPDRRARGAEHDRRAPERRPRRPLRERRAGLDRVAGARLRAERRRAALRDRRRRACGAPARRLGDGERLERSRSRRAATASTPASFTPTAAGAVNLTVTATAAGASDTRSVSGLRWPTTYRSSPAAVRSRSRRTRPGRTPGSPSTAQADQRIASSSAASRSAPRRAARPTSRSSSPTARRSSPLGSARTAASSTRARSRDRPLPDPRRPAANAAGSMTLTLYDVPAGRDRTITPGGAPVGRDDRPRARTRRPLRRHPPAIACLKLSNVTIGTSSCSSARVSILKPDGSTLVFATPFGTSGGFVDTKTLPGDGHLHDPRRPAADRRRLGDADALRRAARRDAVDRPRWRARSAREARPGPERALPLLRHAASESRRSR